MDTRIKSAAPKKFVHGHCDKNEQDHKLDPRILGEETPVDIPARTAAANTAVMPMMTTKTQNNCPDAFLSFVVAVK